MQTHVLRSDPRHAWALIFETDDPVIETLERFMDENEIRAGHLTALGAFRQATLAYFDWEEKEYLEIPVDEQMEVASLTGSLARDEDDNPRVHVHCVLSRKDGTAVAGHLVEARVRPTLELFVHEADELLVRRFDEESRLELIRR